MKLKLCYLNWGLIALLACLPSALNAQEETTFATEIRDFGQELENNARDEEDAAVAEVDAKAEKVEEEKALLESKILYGINEDGTQDPEGGVVGALDKQTGGEAEALMNDASGLADGKIQNVELEAKPMKDVTTILTAADEMAMKRAAYEDVELDFPMSFQSEFVLDYEIDQIETLLDQKLDLIDGILTADIPAPEISSDYGFNSEDLGLQTAAVSAVDPSDDIEMATNGNKYTENYKLMINNEGKNMDLIYNDVMEREAKIEEMNLKSQTRHDQGGVVIALDDLDDEVTNKLLHIDRKILDILTEDAYEKDMAENEDLLVHPITGKPLKGYAKRKALKELDGPYGKVEAMRVKNLEGEVLEEDPILAIMMQVYDGYNPYAY